MDRWREWLEAHVSRTPVPTGQPGPVPRLDPKPRVILFDVYGTLLAARYGDLEAQGWDRPPEESFVKTARFFGFSEETGRKWAEGFFRAVSEEHERCRALGIRRAEVLVERIWEELLRSAPDPPDAVPDPVDAALYRELTANPVAPFEGAAEALAALRRDGYRLGLASNAQFYTLPVLDYALGGGAPFLEATFDPDWLFFSFELGFAKPDPHFFRLIVTRARRCGLKPEDVLMVGNDPVNDIEAARLHGLQAVLFAPGGTARSSEAVGSAPRIGRFDALVQAVAGR